MEQKDEDWFGWVFTKERRGEGKNFGWFHDFTSSKRNKAFLHQHIPFPLSSLHLQAASGVRGSPLLFFHRPSSLSPSTTPPLLIPSTSNNIVCSRLNPTVILGYHLLHCASSLSRHLIFSCDNHHESHSHLSPERCWSSPWTSRTHLVGRQTPQIVGEWSISQTLGAVFGYICQEIPRCSSDGVGCMAFGGCRSSRR